MIPLRDSIRARRFPWVTIAIIAANAAVFLVQASMDGPTAQAAVLTHGVVPARFLGALQQPAIAAPQLGTIVTSMFMHGGILHLLGNMWFLWIFGDNVEDRTGRAGFLAFYLCAGLAAALSQIALSPHSDVPMVGASGAIAGVLGAYMFLYPRARVLALVPIVILVRLIELPAVWFLGLWFGLQVLSSLLGGGGGGGVAWYAHIFGFIAGFLMALPLGRAPEPIFTGRAARRRWR